LLGLRLDSTRLDDTGLANAHGGAPSRLAKIRAIKVCQATFPASSHFTGFHRQAELYFWQPGWLVWPGTAQNKFCCSMMGGNLCAATAGYSM